MDKHRVSTTLSSDLYKLAKRKKIVFSEALEIGIKQKLSLTDEKRLLLRELEIHNQAIDSIMKRLNDIDKMEEYVEEFTIDNVLNIVDNVTGKGKPVIYSSIEYWAAELDMKPGELQAIIKEAFPGIEIMHVNEVGTVLDDLFGD